MGGRGRGGRQGREWDGEGGGRERWKRKRECVCESVNRMKRPTWREKSQIIYLIRM